MNISQGESDGGSRPSQQSMNLPSQALQNQIHELAKTLPPPRKQNTACDACRSRKVKCNQLPGSDKCQHCLAKNYPCTHFVQQATSEKKRTASAKRPRTLSSSVAGPSSQRISPSETSVSPHPISPTFNTNVVIHPAADGIHLQRHFVTVETPTKDILSYLFAPPDSSPTAGFSNGYAHARPSSAFPINGQDPYASWGPTAHNLADDSYRSELALDLTEVYFQIVHTRLPLLNPAQFRARLKFGLYGSNSGSMSNGLFPPVSPMTPPNGHAKNGHVPAEQRPLHPALVATVIAWGAKFSEHPLLLADREHNRGQSSLAKTLINRTRELAEDLKVHRIPSTEHVVTALLIEPMQSQSIEDSNGFHGFWLGSAIRLLLDLQINHKSVMSKIQDPEARGTMIFAWWMACLADAYRSVYYRRKPMLDDDDYDIDFYTVGPVPPANEEAQSPQPSPREQLEFLGYYRASHALARISRQISRQFWRPSTESDGVPIDVLVNLMTMLNDWREEHLHHVGVPSNFEAEWDFVSAVTACASDATYHIMWIIMFNALDDFGIREVNDMVRSGSPGHLLPNHMEIEDTKRKVMEEALHGALRIAGLAGVLASNGYLRLDSAVMHVSCIKAGMLLARLGRPEVSNCIVGLEQYSYAYEECAEQAAEMRRVYGQATIGEVEVGYMASVVPRMGDAAHIHHAAQVDRGMYDMAY